MTTTIKIQIEYFFPMSSLLVTANRRAMRWATHISSVWWGKRRTEKTDVNIERVKWLIQVLILIKIKLNSKVYILKKTYIKTLNRSQSDLLARTMNSNINKNRSVIVKIDKIDLVWFLRFTENRSVIIQINQILRILKNQKTGQIKQ
jgi:hypothetical protein